MAIDVTTVVGDIYIQPGPRVFTLTGAISGSLAGGPHITRPGEVDPALRALLFHRPELVVPVAALDGALRPTFQEQLASIGTGSVALHNADPDLAQVWDHECVVRFEVAGRAAFTMIVNDVNHTAITAGEEVDEVTELTGRAHISVLEESVVYPPRGPDRLPFSDERLFSWPATDFNDATWGTAAVMAINNAIPAGNDGWWASAEFPDPSAAWIWAPGTSANLTPGAPEGTCYFRHSFNLNADASLLVYATIDNGGNLFFDGAPLIEEMGDLTQVYDGVLDGVTAGTHTIAVEGVNGNEVDGSQTPGAIIVSVWKIGPDGDPYELVTNTAAGTWKGVFYPPRPPGMTPGEVIRRVITEGQIRGCFPQIQRAFNDNVDSAGRPWPVVGDISTKIGTNLWTFIGEEMASTYVDIWMSPGDFTLYAWVVGTRGHDRSVTLSGVTDETDPYSGNLAGLTHRTIR